MALVQAPLKFSMPTPATPNPMAPPSPDSLPTNPDVGTYGNALKGLLTDPNSFQTDPGYQFARQQALDAVMRSNSNMLGSGNLMNALEDRASGLASQAYDNRVNQLSNILGQQQQFQLGSQQNAIGAQNSANQYALGSMGAQNEAQGLANQYALGQGNLANQATEIGNQFALGQGQLGLGYTNAANNFTLGQQSNANNAQRNIFDYNLGAQSNANQFYNDQTNRAAQESNAYNQGSQNNLNWTKFYYNLFPPQGSFSGNQYTQLKPGWGG